jgi:hypothetical protein
MVYFDSSSTSEVEDPKTPESEKGQSGSEDNTAKVNKLLQSIE